MPDVLVMFRMVFIRVVSKKNFHLFGGAFCFGVAGEVSDLSRGAGLLLFGSLVWAWGMWVLFVWAIGVLVRHRKFCRGKHCVRHLNGCL